MVTKLDGTLASKQKNHGKKLHLLKLVLLRNAYNQFLIDKENPRGMKTIIFDYVLF